MGRVMQAVRGSCTNSHLLQNTYPRAMRQIRSCTRHRTVRLVEPSPAGLVANRRVVAAAGALQSPVDAVARLNLRRVQPQGLGVALQATLLATLQATT